MAHVKRKYKVTIIQEKIQQIEIWKPKFAQEVLVPIIRNMYIIQDTEYKKR